MPLRGRGDSGWPSTLMSSYLSPAAGAWMSEPPAELHGSGLAFPPPRARRLVFAAVTGLALAVALAAAGVIIASRQLPPRPVATLSGPVGQAPCSAAFSPDGTTLAVADNSGNIYLWNLAARRVTATVPASSDCASSCPIAFSPDGTLLAVGQTENSGTEPSGAQVYLWDLAARRWAGTLTAGKGPIGSLAFGRHGILAVGADDDHAYLWDVPARRLIGAIARPSTWRRATPPFPRTARHPPPAPSTKAPRPHSAQTARPWP
jgi:WD40 repeat protein